MPNFLHLEPREPNLLPHHVGKVANTRSDLTAVTKRPAGTVAGRWVTLPANYTPQPVQQLDYQENMTKS